MDKKKTEKLGIEELEKRKAPFASPIVNREGEGRAGSGGTESYIPKRDIIPDEGDLGDPQPLPKPPIVHRIE